MKFIRVFRVLLSEDETCKDCLGCAWCSTNTWVPLRSDETIEAIKWHKTCCGRKSSKRSGTNALEVVYVTPQLQHSVASIGANGSSFIRRSRHRNDLSNIFAYNMKERVKMPSPHFKPGERTRFDNSSTQSHYIDLNVVIMHVLGRTERKPGRISSCFVLDPLPGSLPSGLNEWG